MSYKKPNTVSKTQEAERVGAARRKAYMKFLEYKDSCSKQTYSKVDRKTTLVLCSLTGKSCTIANCTQYNIRKRKLKSQTT